LEEFDKMRLIDFVIEFLEAMQNELSELMFFPHNRARIASERFLIELLPSVETSQQEDKATTAE